ncbi:HAD-IIB family hydrolase [Pseudomonadota bacterium]
MNRLLLCTDLDRTVIPNGSQPESAGARELFSRLVGTADVQLAYVSGRHRALIEQAIDEYRLPLPDFAIADVGSTVYQLEEGVWKRWQSWDNEIGGDWQGHSTEALHSLLSDIGSLQLQEQEKQNLHKLSYYLPLHQDHQPVLAEIKQRLQAGLIRANLIWSIDEAEEIALLDILPAGANKLHAIEFLMQQRGYDSRDTIFAGDSGNDLDVLLSPIQSVLVGNADSEVRSAAAAAGQNIYLASGGFLNMNGNYSSGILEGIVHYRPEFIPLIESLQQ